MPFQIDDLDVKNIIELQEIVDLICLSIEDEDKVLRLVATLSIIIKAANKNINKLD